MEWVRVVLMNSWPLLLEWVVALMISVLPTIALVYFIRYVMGIKRLAAIAEENLELNRQRTVHLEKIATVLVSMKKSVSQSDLPLK